MTRLDVPNLYNALDALLRQIPRGKVSTYGRLAEALGHRNAARWIGQYLASHACGAGCACHRVVRADGQIGLYSRGETSDKARLLREEGVTVEDNRVDLERFAFDGFTTDRPLARLATLQEETAKRVRLCRRTRVPKTVGGVDISYPHDELAVGVYALCDVESGELLWTQQIVLETHFPYITGFLAFRELPVYMRLIEAAREAKRLSPVVLVDGSGLLHPRSAGVACQLGVMTDCATIGVTKNHLCGHTPEEATPLADGSLPIVYNDRITGMAVPPTPGSRNPLFVSPGHRVDVDFAAALVRSLLHEHRLPEPIYWADRLSRAAGKELA